MKLFLLISLLAGPTLYEWTDAKGGLHYTNDPSTIPANAKRKVTTGAEVMVSPAAGKGDGGVAPSTPAPTGLDSCVQAQKTVDQLERQLQEAKQVAPQTEEKENLACQEQLRLMGEPAFASCMAGRTGAPSKGAVEALQAQLESARDTLRRAQVSGCH
jgi:hypothetical protein